MGDLPNIRMGCGSNPWAQEHLWEPHKPRLRPLVPISVAGQSLGLHGLPATSVSPYSCDITLCPVEARRRARAAPTAAPGVVPEEQPLLLLEPHRWDLLAAAIMVS